MNSNQAIDDRLTPENQIMLCAASATSMQEVVDSANAFLKASIVVADSLHYILALTEDLKTLKDEELTWPDLIDAGIVPPVIVSEDGKMPPVPPHVNRRGGNLGKNIDCRKDLPTSSGLYCTMFDLMDHDSIVLKLAITTPRPLTHQQQQTAVILATAMHNSYYRLGVGTREDARGHYLRELLLNPRDSVQLPLTPGEFDSSGPFCMICFEISNLGVHNLAFVSAFANLTRQPNVLSTHLDDSFVLLMNTKYRAFDLVAQMDSFAANHHFPMVISHSFAELGEARNVFPMVRDAAAIAAQFHGARGMQPLSEYMLYYMFEEFNRKAVDRHGYYPDIKTLWEYDQKRNTQYLQTVYCYLLHNCEAPATAQVLFIHRNTLDKRLRKIETLIAAKWRSVSYCYQMLYSAYVLLKAEGQLQYYPPIS